MNKLLIVLFIFLLLPIMSLSQSDIVQQVYDFGHVGIGYNLRHTFKYVNTTEKPIFISKAQATCDCSSVLFRDSLIQPGDTAYFHLSFSTKDYYGPTNKSIDVVSDNPIRPEFKFFYVSIVGQWYDGLKPQPLSVFFLPGKNKQTVTLPNYAFDEISIEDYQISDSIFTIDIINKTAAKTNKLEFEITASDNIPRGTYYSTLTLTISTSNEEPMIMTVPVKVVRY